MRIEDNVEGDGMRISESEKENEIHGLEERKVKWKKKKNEICKAGKIYEKIYLEVRIDRGE